jgi:DNA polymerase III subunit beta
MKFEAPAGDLARALGAAKLALDNRTNIEALHLVRIVADGGQVGLTVDSLDLRVCTSVSANVDEAGEVSARAETLAGLVARLPGDSIVKVQGNANAVAVSTGSARFRVPGLPPDDLPRSSGIEESTPAIESDTEDFLRLFEATAFAIAIERSRYYLNGIYLHTAGTTQAPTLRAVATDGCRLAQFELPLPNGAGGIPGIIIPHKTVNAVIRLLDRRPAPESVALRATTKLIEIALPGLVLTSKLIDGAFPDYARVMPAATNNIATVDRAALRATLARFEAVADQKAKARALGLSWDCEEAVLRLCLSGEPGVAEDVLAAETAGTGKVAANINFVADTLDAFAGKTVRIASASPADPIAIRDPDDGAMLVIVMPMKWLGARSAASKSANVGPQDSDEAAA